MASKTTAKDKRLPMNKELLDQSARLISHLMNPVMVALVVFGAAVTVANNTVWIGVLGVLFYGIVPAIALGLLYKKGIIADIYLAERQQRGPILLWGTLCYLVGLGVLYWAAAPRVALIIGGTFCSTALLVWGVNRFWKISIHSAGISGGVVLMLAIGGKEWWPLLLCLPLVAWARLWLRVHTWTQVIGGMLLGSGTTVVLLHTIG